MIVCVCNNISDREIRQAAALGLNTMSALRDDLGIGTCCGKCKSCAKTVLKEYLTAGAGQAPAMQEKSLAFKRRTQAA